MGYDMRWRRRPDGEAEAVEEARKAFYAACTVRDQYPREESGTYTAAELEARRKGELSYDDLPANATERYRAAQGEVDSAAAKIDSADRSYFRLNIWGMGRARSVMHALGVLYDDYELGHARWPDVPDEGYYDWENREGEHAPEKVAAYRRYDAQRLAIVSWSPEGRQGIPAHKFGSNDGWLVLPEEAFYAASTMRAADPRLVAEALTDAGLTGGRAEWWFTWVEWLDGASKHDGFEVW
jgi:hypothetical protein